MATLQRDDLREYNRVKKQESRARRKPPGTAITVRRPPKEKKQIAKRTMPNPAGRDLHRWFKYEGMGMTVDQIAQEEGSNVLTVQSSIDYMKEYKFRNQTSILEAKAVSVCMDQMDGMGEVLKRGMKAEKVIYVNKETGEAKTAPDIAMQLKAVDRVQSLIEKVQPKTPLLQSNTQVNFGIGGNGSGSGMSFEAVLRKKRGEKGLANEQEVEAIEAELTHEESVAKEFEDFGGDDEEGDEESGDMEE
jgi:hypothetical protein